MSQPGKTQSPIRVMIVDDHKIIREGLREFIESQSGMRVIGSAGNSAEAIDLATREQPDVIVLDLDLGEDSGLKLLPELLNVARQTRVIVLTGVRDRETRDNAMKLGAKGVVLKEHGTADLLSAIEKVYHTGDYWFEPGAAKRLFEKAHAKNEPANPEENRIAALTPTERTLITYIGKGLDNRQIAAQMHMAESTVRNNLTRIYDKLEIKGGRLALLVYAYKHRLVQPSP